MAAATGLADTTRLVCLLSLLSNQFSVPRASCLSLATNSVAEHLPMPLGRNLHVLIRVPSSYIDDVIIVLFFNALRPIKGMPAGTSLKHLGYNSVGMDEG